MRQLCPGAVIEHGRYEDRHLSIRALRIAIRFYVRSPGVRGTSGPPRLGEAT
jgi:hypothetical protein